MATGFNTQAGNGEYRLQFETDNRDHYLFMQEAARKCVDNKPHTNADRIRAMSDAELANFMAERNANESTLLLKEDHGLTAVQIEELKHRIYCAWMAWLRSPASEGETP